MSNLHYIETTDKATLISELLKRTPKGAHFTNGTYKAPKELIVPTTLAGFKRASQHISHLALVIAVNSDISMLNAGFSDCESQEIRAKKVAEPLAALFPEREVIVVYYDEETPFELYQALAKHNLTRTLHKWGYGTSENAPEIKGAEFFQLVFGFPLPNDRKPAFHHLTTTAKEPQTVTVVDLRQTLFDKSGKLLFKLPASLSDYQSPEAADLEEKTVVISTR